MHDESRRDWTRFSPAAIPTKTQLPQLERWLDHLRLPHRARVLDLGCGAGEITRTLADRGFEAVGVDINPQAIAHCRRAIAQGRFYQRDVAAVTGFDWEEAPFDAVVCQLVASIVGDASDREQLARNAHDLLRHGGALFMSFSGLSHDVNEAYAELYARDFAETQSYGTYWSRAADGERLYRTHHYAQSDVEALLAGAGFAGIDIESQIEVSSRRQDQRARFYYATCRRP